MPYKATRTTRTLKIHGHTTIKGGLHMEYIIILLGLVIALFLGYIVGLVQGGLKVTINHVEKTKENPVDETGEPKYNRSYEDMADPQMKSYLEQNHGQIKL